MAAESGVVSKHLALDHRLACPHGTEEVRLVVSHVAVMGWRSVDLVLVFDLDAGLIRRMDETGRTELGVPLRLPADYRIVRLRTGEDDWRSGQTVLAVSALGLTPTCAVLVTGPGPRAQWMALAGLSGQLLEPKNDAEVDNLFKALQKRPDAR